MSKRDSVSFIYLLVVIATLILRISGGQNIYAHVGIDADYYFTLIVQLLCFFVLPTALYIVFTKNRSNNAIRTLTADFGFVKLSFKDFLRTFIIGVCTIYMATVISYLWSSMLHFFGYKSSSLQVEYDNVGILILQLIMTAVLPGVFEEYTHRGLLFAGYRQYGFKVVILSALTFSLMHQNIRQTGYTFFDGIGIALLAYYTGSIYPSMFVHFLNNAVSVFWDYGDYTGGWLSFMNVASAWFYGSLIGFIVGAILFVVCAVVVIFLFKRMRDDAVSAGRIERGFFAVATTAEPLRKDVLMWITIVIGVIATAMSFVWGIV